MVHGNLNADLSLFQVEVKLVFFVGAELDDFCFLEVLESLEDGRFKEKLV